MEARLLRHAQYSRNYQSTTNGEYFHPQALNSRRRGRSKDELRNEQQKVAIHWIIPRLERTKNAETKSVQRQKKNKENKTRCGICRPWRIEEIWRMHSLWRTEEASGTWRSKRGSTENRSSTPFQITSDFCYLFRSSVVRSQEEVKELRFLCRNNGCFVCLMFAAFCEWGREDTQFIKSAMPSSSDPLLFSFSFY